jgi:hypothetical protein
MSTSTGKQKNSSITLFQEAGYEAVVVQNDSTVATQVKQR